MPTPLRRAISRTSTVPPRSAKTTPAASVIAARLRSMRLAPSGFYA